MKSRSKILVLDDDPNIVEVIVTRLESMDFNVHGFTDPSTALNALRHDSYCVLVTDQKMPEMDGMVVLREAKKIDPDVEVIILTAYGSIEGAVRAIKEGAYDYISKPFEPLELVTKIEKAMEKRELKQRVRFLEQEVGDSIEYRIYAESPAMQRTLAIARQVSDSDSTVLIQGESGTGKELIARMIHYESRRKRRKFVVMDCGATPPSLIESELFGYVRGAFTGAIKDKRGIIEEADMGTLFLDEIGNISPEMQTRLLRVLESGEFRRVGELKPKQVDIRVIAATNADLEAKVEDGSFRSDLYYRLKVISIKLPSLRERKEDIPGLVQIFLSEFSRKTGKKIIGIDKRAMNILFSHQWPGNVRELKNIIESAVVLCKGSTIGPDEILLSGIGEKKEENLNTLESQEKTLVIQALKKANWVQKDAAALLGISRRVINYKIKKYNIRPEKIN